MSTTGTTSQTRKFQFFDEIMDDINFVDDNNPNKINEIKDNENEKTEKLNINLSSVVPMKDMQVLDGVIFICATVIYKETKKKNTGILKILNNKVIDQYFMFNKYYDYIIMKYMDKPLLIVLGSQKKMTETAISENASIKFYNASNFIDKKDERYPIKEQIKDMEENYPELLQREIKLYKKGETNV